MRIENQMFDDSWGMIYEDTLLDVAAAIAATEPSRSSEQTGPASITRVTLEGSRFAATPVKAAGAAQPENIQRWAVCVSKGIN